VKSGDRGEPVHVLIEGWTGHYSDFAVGQRRMAQLQVSGEHLGARTPEPPRRGLLQQAVSHLGREAGPGQESADIPDRRHGVTVASRRSMSTGGCGHGPDWAQPAPA
jgi:hypothetical protein